MTEPCSTPAWTWGRTRFWLDDSLNDLVAVSDRHVATRGTKHVHVWCRPDGLLVHRFVPRAREVDAWFVRWCARTGAAPIVRVPGRVEAMALAPDGSKLVAGGRDGVVRCFALAGMTGAAAG